MVFWQSDSRGRILNRNVCSASAGRSCNGSAYNTRFIITIITTRNSTVMMPPARMKSGTR